jgi:hypothetical protein
MLHGVDVIALAQNLMARIEKLSEKKIGVKVLSSLPLCVLYLKNLIRNELTGSK